MSRDEVIAAVADGCKWGLILSRQIRYFDLERKAVKGLVAAGFEPCVDDEDGVVVNRHGGGRREICDVNNNRADISLGLEDPSERAEFSALCDDKSQDLWVSAFWLSSWDFGDTDESDAGGLFSIQLAVYESVFEVLELTVCIYLPGPPDFDRPNLSRRSSSGGSQGSWEDEYSDYSSNWSAESTHERLCAWEFSKTFNIIRQPGELTALGSTEHFVAPVNLYPGSPQSLALIRHWHQFCATTHGYSIDRIPCAMPKMILQISDDPKTIRLLSVAPGMRERYLALSYCWGHSGQNITLLRENITQLQFGIPTTDLDQTIRDAIAITRGLGYQYLWVDALCIIQDDSVFKSGEIARMDQIYRNATICIVASRSRSVKDGFLSKRVEPGHNTPDCVFSVNAKDPDTTSTRSVILIPVDDTLSSESMGVDIEEPWDKRAWTLQENLLSGRQLKFETKKTTWACNCAALPYVVTDGWTKDRDYEEDEMPETEAFQQLNLMMRNSRFAARNEGTSSRRSRYKVWVRDKWSWSLPRYKSSVGLPRKPSSGWHHSFGSRLTRRSIQGRRRQ
ncbi:heterokaryon incompatibility protein-domain-containing protein [Xylaria telfairii]|nr:heterokaryon incompatibility protein-domain-containing protein [Xylaria telfairii]